MVQVRELIRNFWKSPTLRRSKLRSDTIDANAMLIPVMLMMLRSDIAGTADSQVLMLLRSDVVDADVNGANDVETVHPVVRSL